MPVRRSPNGARHVRPQPGRNRPERVVAINRNAWSQSIGTGGRNHPVRARSGEDDSCAGDFHCQFLVSAGCTGVRTNSALLPAVRDKTDEGLWKFARTPGWCLDLSQLHISRW